MSDYKIEQIRSGAGLNDVLGDVSADTPIEEIIDCIRAYLEITTLIKGDGRDEMAMDAIHIALPHHADEPLVIEAVQAECVRRIANTIYQGHENRTYFGPRLDKDKRGRFELIEQIGAGSNGTVWYALDREFEGSARAEVALMILDDKRQGQFVHAKSVEHDNVAPIRSQGTVGVHRPQSYIAYQFIEGPTLNEWMRHRALLNQRDIVSMLLQICEGVQAIHTQFMAHCDLKPSNIILHKDQPVIIDYGVAPIGCETQPTGSPLYMAPEQRHQDLVADSGLVDIYSIGAIGYWLCTGKFPNGDDHAQAYSNFENKVSPDCSMIAGQLSLVIEKCTSYYSSKRYQSVGDLIADLRAIQALMPTSFQEKSAVSSYLLVRRHPMIAGVLMTLLVSLGYLSFSNNARATQALDRYDRQTKMQESILAHLRMDSLNLQVRGVEPDPTVFWMVSQMAEFHDDPWVGWDEYISESNGQLRTVKMIEEAEANPDVSGITIAYWYWLHARMQRSTNMQEHEVLASYNSARDRLTEILGETDPIIPRIDDEIDQYQLYN